MNDYLMWQFLFYIRVKNKIKDFDHCFLRIPKIPCARKLEYLERTNDPGQATGKLYHLQLRVECTLFCNLQSWARIHAALVIGTDCIGSCKSNYHTITVTYVFSIWSWNILQLAIPTSKIFCRKWFAILSPILKKTNS
jgi:hypothetical protein